MVAPSGDAACPEWITDEEAPAAVSRHAAGDGAVKHRWCWRFTRAGAS